MTSAAFCRTFTVFFLISVKNVVFVLFLPPQLSSVTYKLIVMANRLRLKAHSLTFHFIMIVDYAASRETIFNEVDEKLTESILAKYLITEAIFYR